MIRIGTGERGGTFHAQGLALRAVLEPGPPIGAVEVVESGLGVSLENAERLGAGEIDFGFVSAPWVVAARNGTPPFTHRIDLRVAAPMNVGPNFFVARACSDVRKVADLRGRKVAVGLKSSGIAQHAEAIFAALELGSRDLERVHVDFSDGAELLAAGTVDAQFQCPIPNRVMTSLSERVDLRVLAYDPPHLEAALKYIPDDCRFTLRQGAFRGVDQDTAQLGVLNLLATHARVDADTVRHVAGTIASAAVELGCREPLFAGLADLLATMKHRCPAATGADPLELHAGARLAYRQAGLLA
jgi:TRAP transporter TAXI family solute receptor